MLQSHPVYKQNQVQYPHITVVIPQSVSLESSTEIYIHENPHPYSMFYTSLCSISHGEIQKIKTQKCFLLHNDGLVTSGYSP